MSEFTFKDGEVITISDAWASPLIDVKMAEWRTSNPANLEPQHPQIKSEMKQAGGKVVEHDIDAPKGSPEHDQYLIDLQNWQNREITERIHLKLDIAIALTDKQLQDVEEARGFGYAHSKYDGAFFVFDHLHRKEGQSIGDSDEWSDLIDWIDSAPWGLKWGKGASLATFRAMFRLEGKESQNGAVPAVDAGGGVSKPRKQKQKTATDSV